MRVSSDYQGIKDKYDGTPYEPLEPLISNTNQATFKFNSVTHFVSWVKALDKNFSRGAKTNDSESGKPSFTLSRNLDDAYRVISETTFDPRSSKELETMVRDIRKRTKYSEESGEIDVPEYLAGSRSYWLEMAGKKTYSRVINDTLFIDASYNCNRDSKDALEAGRRLLVEIYRRKVIPRKVVLVFQANGVRYQTSGSWGSVFIDVPFSDINGVAQALHPSTFRRLIFRVVEIYPDLSAGYGRPLNLTTQAYLTSIDRFINLKGAPQGEFDDTIDVFLGVINRQKPK